ncbi:Uncharacterized protein GBIM_13530 [Gryllus bimaculatus]|nr:Uncharacterized protein GBIM_13530 [Gryllus bimaculatus]
MAVSSLDLEVGSAMFLDSRLHLRCAAWLFNVYRRNSVEYELQEDAPQLASERRHRGRPQGYWRPRRRQRRRRRWPRCCWRPDSARGAAPLRPRPRPRPRPWPRQRGTCPAGSAAAPAPAATVAGAFESQTTASKDEEEEEEKKKKKAPQRVPHRPPCARRPAPQPPPAPSRAASECSAISGCSPVFTRPGRRRSVTRAVSALFRSCPRPARDARRMTAAKAFWEVQEWPVCKGDSHPAR